MSLFRLKQNSATGGIMVHPGLVRFAHRVLWRIWYIWKALYGPEMDQIH